MARSGLNLTFGLEIEFDLAVLPATFGDPHPNHKRFVYEPIRGRGAIGSRNAEADAWHDVEDHEVFSQWVETWMHNARHHLAHYLKRHGINACAAEYSGGGLERMEHCRYTVEQRYHHQVWRIGNKEMHPPQYKHGYFLLPMELQSPPMPYNETSLQQMRDVLRRISERYIILCDMDSAIHVHIGNSGERFPISTLVNFALLAYTFEQQMIQIHPPRFQKHEEDGTTYPPSINGYSVVTTLGEVKGHQDRIFALETIAACTQVDELVFHVNNTYDPRKPTYNLLGVSKRFRGGVPWPDDPFKKTVEFRQHKSHFDGEEVTHWIYVCIAFFIKADSMSTENILDQCRLFEMQPLEERSLPYVLFFLGCPEQANYYASRLYPTDAMPLRSEHQTNKTPRLSAYDRAISYGPIDVTEVRNYPGWSMEELHGRREDRPRLPPRDPEARLRDKPGPSYPEVDYPLPPPSPIMREG